MPKLLMIAYHFPPIASGGIRRTLEFVRHLPEHGWEPLVLTVDPRTSQYKSDAASLASIPEGLVVVRTASREPLWAIRNLPRWHLGQLVNFLMPIDRSVTWVAPAVRAGLEMIERYDPDVIYSSSSPFSAHLIGAALHRHTGKPWVADWRDLWTQCVALQGPTPLHSWFNRKMERRWWREATLTVTHSHGHKDLILRDFPALNADRIQTIYMGYSPAEFASIEPARFEKFTMVYAGTFYGLPVLPAKTSAERARAWVVDHILDSRGVRYLNEVASPLYLLQALQEALHVRPDLRGKIDVRFLGFPRSGNLQMITQLGLDGIVEHVGQMPFRECVAAMKGAHVLLLVMLPSEPGRSDFVPSKVPEYLGAQRPILAMIPASEVRGMIEEADAGFVVDAKGVDGGCKAILELYRRYEAGSLEVVPNESVLRRLSWACLSAQMADVLALAATSGC